MTTATEHIYVPSLKTGAGLNYPVVMKAPYDYTEYIIQFEVKEATEIAMGDLAAVVLDTTLKIGATGASSAVCTVIVLDSPRNKALLEAAGTTVSKAAQFAAGDKVDCLLLIPGFILSVKGAGVDISFGNKLITTNTNDGEVTPGVTAGAVVGYALTDKDWEDVATVEYIAMMVK